MKRKRFQDRKSHSPNVGRTYESAVSLLLQIRRREKKFSGPERKILTATLRKASTLQKAGKYINGIETGTIPVFLFDGLPHGKSRVVVVPDNLFTKQELAKLHDLLPDKLHITKSEFLLSLESNPELLHQLETIVHSPN